MTDPIPPSRRKRFARRAVMALVGVVLLVTSYVSSWGALHWLLGRGTISIATYDNANGTLDAPVSLAIEKDDSSLSRFLLTFAVWCTHSGGGGTTSFADFWDATGRVDE